MEIYGFSESPLVSLFREEIMFGLQRKLRKFSFGELDVTPDFDKGFKMNSLKFTNKFFDGEINYIPQDENYLLFRPNELSIKINCDPKRISDGRVIELGMLVKKSIPGFYFC